MNTSRRSTRLLVYIGIPTITAFLLYLIWDGTQTGWRSEEFCAGLGLLMAIGALIYLKRMENVSLNDISRRIRKEYPSDIQPQVVKIYEQLKIKELDGLFPKILDDAHGDINQLKKLAGVAESVGWQAFLENKW